MVENIDAHHRLSLLGGKITGSYPRTDEGPVRSAVFSQDETKILTSSDDGTDLGYFAITEGRPI